MLRSGKVTLVYYQSGLELELPGFHLLIAEWLFGSLYNSTYDFIMLTVTLRREK